MTASLSSLRVAANKPSLRYAALPVLLVATAVLYLWGLGASGWANAYYSAAAQAGSASWKALFFGSLDAGNSITVDKTPASLWVMGLSARLFGVNSWSLLVPQALMGVAAVALLYATVSRWSGRGAGLLAGAVLATTPVAALMFRFNNPDALLVLLLVAAAWAATRAIEKASARWLMLAGMFVGFGFLAKMLQAALVVPALALVYLVAAPTTVWRRLLHLLAAGGAMVVAAGWWVAAVQLWPASSRPYIGGSQNNSVLQLMLGYNGFGRITGSEVGSVGPRSGSAGWMRLFDAENGGQIAWLMPAALILLVAGLLVTVRAPRTDRTRAALILWGGWFLVTGAVFSLMAGIYHAYYTVALAPAVGALVGVGSAVLYARRRSIWASATLAAVVAVTAVWAYVLLGRSVDWQAWLRPTVLVAGLIAAVAVLVTARARLGAVAGLVAIVAVLAAPAAYSIQTASVAHAGAIPSAGPAVVGAGPGGFGGPGRFGPGGAGGAGGPGFGGGPGFATGQAPVPGGANVQADGRPRVPQGGAGGALRGRGGIGGLLDAGAPSADVVALLKQDSAKYTWVAAAIGANNAAAVQLGTGLPVMAIGGFNGSDPAPTLAQFQQYVAQGKIHYFIGGGGFRANGGSAAAGEISTWVTQNFTATTVGGMTVYNLAVAP